MNFMKNWNFKKINIIGGTLVGLGGITMILSSFIPIDDSYTQKTKGFPAEGISNLSISSSSDDIEILPSENGEFSFVYYENNQKSYNINQQGNTLEIKQDIIKNIGYIHFMDIGFGRFKSKMPAKLTVYIPEDISFEQFNIEDDYGDVKTYTTISAKNGSFDVDCGNLDISGHNFDELKINLDYGSAIADNITCKNLSLENDNGSVNIDGLKAGNANFDLDYGTLNLSNSSVENNADIQDDHGSVKLNNLSLGKADISLDYGDAAVDGLKCDNIKVENSNGSVKINNMTGNSEFTVKSDYGDIDVNDSELKKADIQAQNGDINVSGCIFEDMNLYSDYGDIEVKLKDSFENYTISAQSNYGDVEVPDKAMGDKWLKAETRNGDITVN